MFVYSQRRGETTELIACSSDQKKLQDQMKSDIKDFIEEIYGEPDEDNDLSWLTPIDENPNFWSDEDEEYETVFQITDVKEI